MSSITVLVTLSAILASVFANHYAQVFAVLGSENLAPIMLMGRIEIAGPGAFGDLEEFEERAKKLHLVRRTPRLGWRIQPYLMLEQTNKMIGYSIYNPQETLFGRVADYNLDVSAEDIAKVDYELRDSLNELENINKRSMGYEFGPAPYAAGFGPSHVEHKRHAIQHLLETHKRAAFAHESGMLSPRHAAELLEAHKRIAAAYGIEHLIQPHGFSRHSVMNAMYARPLGKAQHVVAGYAPV